MRCILIKGLHLGMMTWKIQQHKNDRYAIIERHTCSYRLSRVSHYLLPQYHISYHHDSISVQCACKNWQLHTRNTTGELLTTRKHCLHVGMHFPGYLSASVLTYALYIYYPIRISMYYTYIMSNYRPQYLNHMQ